ncbi:hypothetical protein SLS55_001960 [Diplodia seriata]|uniref:Uncharacterized protein n=1 Tax=Diplodia seriata TaxID=420778 RepID=A0ABR3CQU0_9PEZI
MPPSSAAGARGNPLSRQRSQRIEPPTDSSAVTTPMHPTGSATPGQQPDQPSTDAIWAEMQNTLEEVELSATTGTHVFRPGHSQALDELRTAQIALAQAWARSEAADEEERSTPTTENNQQQQQQRDDLLGGRRGGGSNNNNNNVRGNNDPLLGGKTRPLSAANVLQMDREQKVAGVGPAAAVAAALGAGGAAGAAGMAAAARPRSGTETSVKSQLERDTENDIQLARKRREANDRYFQRVNAGVLDVVAKLEEVAKAMKGVEQESKEIWGDAESVDTASVASK